MSRNALALVDCSSREKLFHFLINTFDRKCTKKEMISPYDDQLIGKMNFRHSGVEHAMFFTYARSSEYPGMKFRNHKVIYLSLDVNDISSDIFNRICTRFGGYIIHNDDLEIGWEKIERQVPDSDDDLSLSEDVVAERSFLFDTEEEGQERKVYRELKLEPDVEEEAEEREWAPIVSESKTDKKAEQKKSDRKQENGREKRENNRNTKPHRANRQDGAQKDRPEKDRPEKDRSEKDRPETKAAEEQKSAPKITVRETLRSHERQKEQREQKKANQKDGAPKDNGQKDAKNDSLKADAKEGGKETQKQNQRRGHRGGRKHSAKPSNKEQAAQSQQT